MINEIFKCGSEQIETDRLILRKFTYDDIIDVHSNWASDEEVQLMYCEPVYKTLADVKGLLDKYISGYNRTDYFRWAVILKEDNRCIGQIAYFLVDEKNRMGEIEYCIGREFQRHGYATEACRQIIRYGIDRIHFHRIQIRCKDINAASEGVIRKCGFNYEGTLRDSILLPDGMYCGMKYFSLLEQDHLYI